MPGASRSACVGENLICQPPSFNESGKGSAGIETRLFRERLRLCIRCTVLVKRKIDIVNFCCERELSLLDQIAQFRDLPSQRLVPFSHAGEP
jgi:hypothetical protein